MVGRNRETRAWHGSRRFRKYAFKKIRKHRKGFFAGRRFDRSLSSGRGSVLSLHKPGFGFAR